MKPQNKKEDSPKTTPTEPTSSTSTKIFEKRFTGTPNPNLVDYDSLTGSARYFIPEKSPCSTKSSMSSMEWEEAFEELDKMMLGTQSNREEEGLS